MGIVATGYAYNKGPDPFLPSAFGNLKGPSETFRAVYQIRSHVARFQAASQVVVFTFDLLWQVFCSLGWVGIV